MEHHGKSKMLVEENDHPESLSDRASSVKHDSEINSHRFTDFDSHRLQNEAMMTIFPAGDSPNEKKQFQEMRVAYLQEKSLRS